VIDDGGGGRFRGRRVRGHKGRLRGRICGCILEELRVGEAALAPAVESTDLHGHVAAGGQKRLGVCFANFLTSLLFTLA
jgi:hypothetical protein